MPWPVSFVSGTADRVLFSRNSVAVSIIHIL